MFSSLFAADSAPPASSQSSDSTVNEIFSSAWEGLTFVVARGAKWSWQSITYSGKWISEMKTTFNTVKGWAQTFWTNLKDHWYTFWIFLRSSFRSIDLKKIYELLTNPGKRQIFTGSNSQLKSVADKMKNIMNKSGSIGFDVGGPFRKLLKTFVEDQQNLSKVVQRLGFLETYVTGSQHSNKKDVVQALVNFFSETEDKITKFDFKYEWGNSAK
ncbi:hypothetical protein MHLP_03840 [Candidatus Mycoplasma haematolamae str. Purdue]|uniref:Uncharacterized protein n=1 Tax=Mycoplasma haematolamae (strain Purdue) TaxID=1212765 RepID=I7BKD8_MYCHA|nr:hypothetical protein [Candidatus Mycoplasma haematolamae]AFO52348.1 hypothetical protein MHLP_03840 [Candidatus Mycoplasma haematolamae str. Purdue]